MAERAEAALLSSDALRTKFSKKPPTKQAVMKLWVDGLLAWAQAVKEAEWERDIQHIVPWTPLRAHLRLVLQRAFEGDREGLVALLCDLLRACEPEAEAQLDPRQVRSVLKDLLAEFGREDRPAPQPLTPAAAQ